MFIHNYMPNPNMVKKKKKKKRTGLLIFYIWPIYEITKPQQLRFLN